MEHQEFIWKQGELLTTQRLDDFTGFLRTGQGIQHGYQAGDYGFGYIRSQKMTFKYITDLQVIVHLPPMYIVFPDGYLYFLSEGIELTINDRPESLLCLSISPSNPKKLGLSYFAGQLEAYANNCLPLGVTELNADTQADNYLKPALDIKKTGYYAEVLKKLKALIGTCDQSIASHFTETGISKYDSLTTLKNLILQAFLGEFISIKAVLKSSGDSRMPTAVIGSVNFFALFKKLLVMTEAFEPYFNEIERLGGNYREFKERELDFWKLLEQLLVQIDCLYFHENILLLCKWLEGLSNVILALCEIHEVPLVINTPVSLVTEQPAPQKKQAGGWI